MFWSGNYIVVRELNFLLKEENVTLSQVLEADDILQECKADNKALMQFLTRPDILAELVSLVTEAPAAGAELAQQYRHASIACEVLTSPLSSLSDRLSLDTQQMHRLADFLNSEPPLNPLLASYFSKTIEMLLERNPKQDWYLYHIVCLRVLDFFKSRRDFLPGLLRHISTSAIADTFKFFIRLDDLFNKIVMEWLEEHQFIECLIQIICGTYVAERAPGRSPDEPEKGTREPSEKTNHADTGTQNQGSPPPPPEPAPAPDEARRRERIAAVASANACALLCDLVATGCAAEGASGRSRTSWALVAKLAGSSGVRSLLAAVFTSGGRARSAAVVHGARLLRQLLDHHPLLSAEGGNLRSQVELAVAPHLPLLHQALLRDPSKYAQEEEGTAESGGTEEESGAVGAARIQTAALLAHLASSEVEEVPTTMLTLGTPAVLVDMFFRYPHNNFLHAQLLAFCRNALANPAYRTQYANNLFVECDLLTRLMDAFEENENKQCGGPRAGYMGHAVLILSTVQAAAAAAELPAELAARWHAFSQDKLDPMLHQFATPLGGTYPSENSYELDNSLSDRLTAYYDASVAGAGAADSTEFIADGLGLDDDENKQLGSAKNRFMELADQRFDDDMWDEAPEGEADGDGEGEGEGAVPPDALREVLGDGSPWGSDSPPSAEPAPGGESWAQFDTLGAALPPVDPFAHYWPYETSGPAGSSPLDAELLSERDNGCVSLATNLLTAMSGMSPADVANIVNANLDLGALPPADLAPPDKLLADTDDTELNQASDKGDVLDSGASQDSPTTVDMVDVTNVPVLAAAVTNSFSQDVVANAHEIVTDASVKGTGADAKVTNADAKVTDVDVKVTDEDAKLTDVSTKLDVTQVPSSNEHSSIDSSNKESVSDGASPENKDLNEITDKINEISLQDKSDSNSSTGQVLDAPVLGEASEASEAAER